MKMRLQALVFAGLVPLLAVGGCARVRSRAAMKDGNKDYKEENFKKAVIDYGRAVELDPNFAEAWFYLGSSHQALYRPRKDTPDNNEHLEKAIEAYKKSLEVNPANTDKLKKVKINTLGALTAIYSEEPYRDYDTALKYAQQLVADNPNDAKNLYAMANLYEKFGKIPEAEELYKKIAEMNANHPRACVAPAEAGPGAEEAAGPGAGISRGGGGRGQQPEPRALKRPRAHLLLARRLLDHLLGDDPDALHAGAAGDVHGLHDLAVGHLPG